MFKRNGGYATVFAAVFLIITLIGACSAFGQSAGVQVSKKEGVGSFLADSKGMTLYVFKKDTPGKSACSGPCVEKWPLFYSEKVAVPAGVNEKDFSTITRDDGKKQTIYKGLPLYYFFKDAKAGDTNGQGVNDVWFVANP